MRKFATVVLALCGASFALAAVGAESTTAEAAAPVEWDKWHVHTDAYDISSLQRGARNYMNYCVGCHSLKYVRYQRMADDLKIPTAQLNANLVQPGANNLDYISTPMPTADAVNWFGKAPPDLSDIARSRGVDYLYQYLKTFYSDPTRATGSNNLALANSAMPAVLSDLEGVKSAVFRDVKAADGSTEKVFDHFETTAPGNLTPEQYDGFVTDTVNFLEYVGEPIQVERRNMGVWVVLFLLLLTALSYQLKKEYWKDVH